MKVRPLIATAALAVGLSACSATSEHDPQALTPTPTTEQENLSQAEILNHADDLMTAGLNELRADFDQTRRLKVLKGACIGWQALGGYLITINPGYYLYDTPKERLSFFIFTSREDPFTPLESPELSQVYLMNGAYEFGRKMSDGTPEITSHIVQEFDIYGEGEVRIEDVTVDSQLARVGNSELGLVDSRTGEQIAYSVLFDNKTESDLPELCKQAGFTPQSTA